MSLDDVDLQVLLLDRVAAARTTKRPAEETVEDAIKNAMGEA